MKGYRRVRTVQFADRELADRTADGLFLAGYRVRTVKVRSGCPGEGWAVTWYDRDEAR